MIKKFSEQSNQRLVRGGVNRRGRDLDAQLIAKRLTDGVERGPGLKFHMEKNSVRLGLQKGAVGNAQD